jgi:glycosyltransferase involved in cell wall biosynthesis
MPAVDFLRSLDCFTYRTNPSWTEAWGRVVTEAMSVGLPVVVHANGGYAQVIRHGKNGFLFHRDEEALELIQKLHNSPELRKIIGANARQTILDLCSKDGFKRHVQFYLQ